MIAGALSIHMRVVVFALISGVLSGLAFDADIDSKVLPGVLFAIAMIAASSARFAKVGLLRMAGFTVLSGAAYWMAVRFAMGVHDFGEISMFVVGATAGLVGATILGLAFAVFFRARPLVRTVALFAIAGTLAGAAFFYLPWAPLSFAVWQASVALVIAHGWSRARV